MTEDGFTAENQVSTLLSIRTTKLEEDHHDQREY